MTAHSHTLPLEPLILTHHLGWFPLAWGWWAVLFSGIVILVSLFALVIWRKKRLIAKKTALRLLTQPLTPHTPSSALELLRQAALSYFPREDIAPLTGLAWYEFLDSFLEEQRFSLKQQQWQHALYSAHRDEQSQDLVDDCAYWVAHALPPKKRRKARG